MFQQWHVDLESSVITRIESLFQLSLQAAEHYLTQLGDFYPFAIALLPDQQFTVINAESPTTHPDPAQHLTALEKILSTEQVPAEATSTIQVVANSTGEHRAISATIKDVGGTTVQFVTPYVLAVTPNSSTTVQFALDSVQVTKEPKTT